MKQWERALFIQPDDSLLEALLAAGFDLVDQR